MKGFCVICGMLLSILTISDSATAATVSFNGQLGFVEVDTGSGIYADVPLGINFSGEIDDVSFNGSISDGDSTTSFSCCIAAGGLEISNDEVLNTDQAFFLNSLLGSTHYNAGDVLDIVNLEGDASTAGGGRIEVGLSYMFDSATFVNSDLSNYPFDPTNLEVGLFFIFEEDNSGAAVYSAGGLINPVPLPAAVWLFVSGVIFLFGSRGFRVWCNGYDRCF